MRETWYVLEDGTAVPPSEVAPNEDGKLAHKGGLVAMRADGETHRSRGVDVDEPKSPKAAADKAAADKAAEAARTPPKRTTEMRPAPAPKPQAKKPGYKTRKAR